MSTKQPTIIRRLSGVLIYLDAFLWIVFGIFAALRLIPGLQDDPILHWGMAILAIGTGVTLVLLYKLSSHYKLAYYLLVGLLGTIAILSITDQVGYLDWISLVLNLAALLLLILDCRQRSKLKNNLDRF